MTFKLLIKNIKKDYRDYGIFIITMMICSAAYYAFFSITSKWYNPSVSIVFDISKMELPIRYGMAGISLITVFLVKHVIDYLLLKKQKEIGLQNLMGLNKKLLSDLFFKEVVILGVISTGIGIVLGGVLAQFVNFFLLKTFNGEIRLIFPYYPDSILYTLAFFTTLFIVVGKIVSRKINSKKIIELLYAEEDEQIKGEGITIKIVHGLTFMINLFFVYLGFQILKMYYDSRIPILGKVIYILLFIFPVIYVLIIVVSKISKVKESELAKKLAVIELIMSVLNIGYVFGTIHLNLPGDTIGIFNYLIRSGVYVALFIYHFFYIYQYRKSDNSWSSIFFSGQIKSKMNRHRSVFSLISLVIYIAVLIFIIQPILTSWSEGYLRSRMVQDIQIITTYNNTTSEEEISIDDYEEVFDFLLDEKIDIKDYTYVDSYLAKQGDFRSRVRYDFPMNVLRLSEYNHLLMMSGDEPVELNRDEYIVQIQEGTDIGNYDESVFLGLETDSKVYKLKANGVYSKNISEYLYNAHVNSLYVINDSEVENMVFVGRSLMIDVEEDFDIFKARELEQLFDEKYDNEDSGFHKYIRIDSIETNSIITIVFIMKTVMTYLSIILLLISFTIIALIELEDSLYNKNRYRSLWQLGISRSKIYRLASKQLLISFWKPLFLGIGGAIIIGSMFMISISDIIQMYVGPNILETIGMVLIIIIMLFIVYYLLTYYMFLSNLKRRD
ncbi:MAG: ABC transporter permease [Tissierellia bacterium]|nr:ABC transporter permease [Tissierellia bacterium]